MSASRTRNARAQARTGPYDESRDSREVHEVRENLTRSRPLRVLQQREEAEGVTEDESRPWHSTAIRDAEPARCSTFSGQSHEDPRGEVDGRVAGGHDGDDDDGLDEGVNC